MRRLFTVSELERRGVTRARLVAGVRGGRWVRVEPRVYAEGPSEPTPVDRARAAVLATGGVASGTFAGWLLGLEGVSFDGPRITLPPTASANRAGVRRRSLPAGRILVVSGVRCTNAIQTLTDLAAELDDAKWEQALECALRRRLVSVPEVVLASAGHQPGALRMRRVLGMRPSGAPPTESLLETLMVQLVRRIPGLPTPDRQVRVLNRYGEEVARVDLAWPALGLFVELDGQHHKNQPIYDASRETAVVAATGWLCGRFTWHDVVDLPVTTARRMAGLADQARRRPRSA